MELLDYTVFCFLNKHFHFKLGCENHGAALSTTKQDVNRQHRRTASNLPSKPKTEAFKVRTFYCDQGASAKSTARNGSILPEVSPPVRSSVDWRLWLQNIPLVFTYQCMLSFTTSILNISQEPDLVKDSEDRAVNDADKGPTGSKLTARMTVY